MGRHGLGLFRKRRFDDQAVSPVFATLLAVALTVTLSAVAYASFAEVSDASANAPVAREIQASSVPGQSVLVIKLVAGPLMSAGSYSVSVTSDLDEQPSFARCDGQLDFGSLVRVESVSQGATCDGRTLTGGVPIEDQGLYRVVVRDDVTGAMALDALVVTGE